VVVYGVLGEVVRAALGISEETDAVAVCISEHSGAISVAWRGVLLERLDEGKLRSELSRILRLTDEEETAAIDAADPGHARV